jgi:predicted O-methyltransferase YrrM
MYKEPKHVVSSYTKNNIGKTLYDSVIKYKPKKIIDFGILYGYSTICLAQGVRDNGFGEIIAYDLFEDYQYKNAIKDVVLNNLQFHNLDQYVSLIKKDFDTWLESEEEFDLLHLDISNTGDTITKIHKAYPNSLILFEGGTKERDNIEWMSKYCAAPINPLQSKLNYKILNHNFPGLSGCNV